MTPKARENLRKIHRRVRHKVHATLELEGNVEDVIKRIQKHVATIPESHRDTAYIDKQGRYYDDGEEYTLCYHTTESDEEVDKRIDQMELERKKQAAKAIEDERKEYARLKKKFEK